jgi:hypothetical protein
MGGPPTAIRLVGVRRPRHDGQAASARSPDDPWSPGNRTTCLDSRMTCLGSPMTFPGSRLTCLGSRMTCPGSRTHGRRIRARRCALRSARRCARRCAVPSCSGCSIPCTHRFAQNSDRCARTTWTARTMGFAHSVPGFRPGRHGSRPDRCGLALRLMQLRLTIGGRNYRILAGAGNQRGCAVPSMQSTGRASNYQGHRRMPTRRRPASLPVVAEPAVLRGVAGPPPPRWTVHWLAGQPRGQLSRERPAPRHSDRPTQAQA